VSQIRVLSLGAGVQSTTLALLAAKCEIGPIPDCAIFADTQWEPKAVDAAIRQQSGFRGQQFMYRSLKPLGEVDLSTAEDRGQLNMFINECEGMCGV
jgi:hypothetical protein